MPSELEDLVEFLHHGNTQIRQVAVESLMGYSNDPAVFKTSHLTPVKDLKLLAKDYAPIAKNALTILINICSDKQILGNLAQDDDFIESLLVRLTNPNERNADEFSMLLANLAKSDSISRLFGVERSTVNRDLSKSKNVMDQLLDLFAKGAEKRYNKNATFDYLAYFFADMAKFPAGQTYFTNPRPRSTSAPPISSLVVFISHPSSIRRRGVASAIKNAAFAISSHPSLLGLALTLDLDSTEVISADDTDILPYLLRPLISGGDHYNDVETDALPEELQLLPPDAKREEDPEILKSHLETLLLFTGTRRGRDVLRRRGVYPPIRECHAGVDDDGVREACDRIVQVIMSDEPEESRTAVEELDEDEQIIEVL